MAKAQNAKAKKKGGNANRRNVWLLVLTTVLVLGSIFMFTPPQDKIDRRACRKRARRNLRLDVLCQRQHAHDGMHQLRALQRRCGRLVLCDRLGKPLFENARPGLSPAFSMKPR